jgi:hypothetical protein
MENNGKGGNGKGRLLEEKYIFQKGRKWKPKMARYLYIWNDK